MIRRVFAWGFVAVLAPLAIEAQEAPVLLVSQTVATYTDGLGSMRGVRELADGRVLIADGLGEALIVWTPGQGADTLTNVGEGPGEYQVPDGLYPLPNDGTLLVDLGNARLVEIGSDLSFGETRPIAQGGMSPGSMGSMTLLLPVGTDDAGRIYHQQSVGGMMSTGDSALIARFDPATGESEELGRVKRPERKHEESGGAQDRRIQIRPVPLSPEDSWNVSWDGRVAVARSGDYRLEWIGPDGLITAGPIVGYDPVDVGRAEQNDVKPFTAGGVRIDGHGRAWVQRHRKGDEAPLFDVFDPSGRRIAQVELPENRRLVGFGENSLYLTRSDEFDFAWLQKYDAPSF